MYVISIVLAVSAQMPDSSPTPPSPSEIIQAVAARPELRTGPPPPELTAAVRRRAEDEILADDRIRDAMVLLDARRRNTDWVQGVEELERHAAAWSLLVCLVHPSSDVQIDVLRALTRIQDLRTVSFLLTYAEGNAVYIAGSERATIHGILQATLAETLSTLTGIEVLLEGQDPEGLLAGIKRRREWERENVPRPATQRPA